MTVLGMRYGELVDLLVIPISLQVGRALDRRSRTRNAQLVDDIIRVIVDGYVLAIPLNAAGRRKAGVNAEVDKLVLPFGSSASTNPMG